MFALALCQAYGQLAALEADNARLQEEDDLPEGKLYPRVKGIEDDDTLTATGARARRECISLDLSTFVSARPKWVALMFALLFVPVCFWCVADEQPTASSRSRQASVLRR